MSKYRQILLILTLVVLWIYIGWRTIFTLPIGIALFPGILLLVSEIILFVQNTLFYILIFKPNKRKVPSFPKDPFTIDLYVATYNESLSIVRRTILACKNLDYPKEYLSIWICDDGRRQEMKELAHSLGVGYISRETNEHAKAGNLNNALNLTKGELVVTMDADMIPKPNFLKNTLGYFVDQQVGFVQMPQSFYNDDIFQYNLLQSKNIPNEQDLFMRLIQTGRDRFNSTIYIGSNTIFRRTALESVDGFATGTITEDMATGMLIQSKGYKTVFHNEVLAQGLAAESLSDFLSQRIRWARGTIQTMRKWNPITLKGLTTMQRLLYLSSLIYWYFGVFKLIFILAPIGYLIFGIPALKASLTGILLFWLPYFLLSSLVENVLLEKRMKRFWSNIYETSVAPFLAWAVLLETFTKRHIPFKVTPKGITSEKAKFNVGFALPHLLLFGLSLIALVMGISRYEAGDKDGTLINLFWLIYNLIIIVPTMLLAKERPKFRKTERFKREFQVELSSSAKQPVLATTIDISETGCSIFVKNFIEIPDQLDMVIHGKYSTFSLKGTLVYYDSHKDGYQLAIQFSELKESLLQLWIKELYGDIPDESLFQFKSKANLMSILIKYVRALRVPIKKNVRKSPRFEINVNCQFVGLPEDALLAFQETAVTTEIDKQTFESINDAANGVITDIGLNGCKLVVNDYDGKQGDTIGVLVSNVNNISLGKVVHIEKQRDNMHLGIKWIEHENGKQLLEFAGNSAKKQG